jgi:hypothetical protein
LLQGEAAIAHHRDATVAATEATQSLAMNVEPPRWAGAFQQPEERFLAA